MFFDNIYKRLDNLERRCIESEKEIRQLKCEHPVDEVEISESVTLNRAGELFVMYGWHKRCTRCGKILEKYHTKADMLKAKQVHYKQLLEDVEGEIEND